MYTLLLLAHSLFRWLVLLSLLFSIAIAINGYFKKKEFTRLNNAFRHWTATICHIQLMLGIVLYTQSPQVQFYFSNEEDISEGDPFFFSVLHLILMLVAIIAVTIGSAKAKRETASHNKFKTMLWWFSAGLLLILVAIPWPFSPLSNRPYIRF